jgi:hypothetical protein
MDGDDVTLPGRFRRQLAAIGNGADIAFSSVVNWKSNTPLVKPQPPRSITPAAAPLHLLVDNPFMNPTMLARTDVLRTLGGVKAVPSEDYELWLRAASAGYQLARIGVPALLYRRHAAQVSQQGAWRAAQATTTVVEESFNELGLVAVGFVPSWFAWRRDRFPKGEAPHQVAGDLEAFLVEVTKLPPNEQVPLRKRVEFIRTRL